MANFKEKIQDLLKNTSSQEVKAVCESFLKETVGKDINPNDMIAESLFADLKKYVDKDSQIGSLLNEKEGYEQSIADIESKISKDAAKRFAENWDSSRRDKKISNVGNHVNNTLKNENISEAAQNNAILEKLSTMTDESAKNFVEKSKIDSYAVKESISAIKGSQIANHPNLKYVLLKFENALMENAPEHLLVSDFLSQITPFKWDPTIKKATDAIHEAINSKATELEVQNTIHAIKSTDTKRFFTDIVNRMSDWVYSEKKNVPTLLKEMKGYMFNPHVKELVNRIMLMENSKGTQFNIPVKDSNCSVSKIFSPVHVVASGQVFKAGNNFYHSADGKFKKLSEKQINGLPKEYLELCESFFNPSIKVTDDIITAYVGKSKVQIDGEKRIFINEKQIDSTTLGSQLMFLTQQTIFRDSSNMANVVMNIYENFDKICEIDYGKAIYSNVFEGVGVYLFKKDGTIFINKVNESMNENKFVRANALQTVNFVKKFLSFNMSESLSEFLEGDFKKKALMEGDMSDVLANIQVLEGELDKIEKAIFQDPSFADVKEIADAKTLLENELNALKSKWQEMNSALKEFESAEDAEEEEVSDEELPSEEPEEIDEDPATDDSSDDDGNDDEGGEPVISGDDAPEPTPAPATDEPATSTDEPIAPVAEITPAGVVDTGLLGAGGAQSTAIPGNDHLDANSGAASSDGATVLDSGFGGAAGQQNQPQASAEIKQDVAPQPVITPGADSAEVIASAVPNDIQIASGDEAAKSADSTPVADNTDAVSVDSQEGGKDEVVIDVKDDVEKDGDSSKEAPKDEVKPEEEEEVKENKTATVSESIGVDSKVKDKVSGKTGTVTAMNDEKFSILLDDGEAVERTLSDLEDVADEIEQTMSKNEAPVEANENADAVENPAGVEGTDTEKEEGAMFVKATLTIDLGPFKAGDEVEIDAANYTSTGDDDPVKLKEPKEGVSEIPKKYLAVADNNPDAPADVDSKVAAVLQQIQDLETFLKDENTKGNKAIEDAKSKIKKFAASLKDENEEEPKTDDKSGEESK